MVGGRLVVRVLGTVEVVAGGVPVSVNRPLERAFAARLAMARGDAVPDRVLARDLWGTDELARPAERLRVVASRLRSGLEDHAVALQRTAAGYALDAEPVDLVAVEQAMDAMDAARRRGDEIAAQAATRSALDRWRGDSLVDLRGVPFGAAEGERLDALRLRLRLDWIERELNHGSDPAAAEFERLVVQHPLHERLVGLSALAMHRGGRQAAARARLAKLRNALADQLGIDPTPETVALEGRLRDQGPRRPENPDRRPPQPPEPPRRQKAPGIPGLPRKSDLVGRGEDLRILVDKLAEPGLVTLVGGPGVGKTRLAWELARQTRDRPVAWLDLARVPTPDGLHSALAAATGVDGDPVRRSTEALSGALLVIDNAEHLVDAVAALVAALRWKSNEISILITSQQPLRVAGEEEHQVGPLNRTDAANLFRSISDGGADADVQSICKAVDWLPLGIELAAGLTRTLTVAEVARDIDRLRLSAGAMKAAIDWSHELLDQPARVVLRRLAIFKGGCTLEAAEQVVTGDGIHQADVAPLLSELSERRLVTIEGTGERRRFGMLETVRAYATEQLRASTDQTAISTRHTDWCIHLAEQADQFGHTNQHNNQAELVRLVDTEEPNLRAAIERSDRVIAIAAPLWWYWWYRGQINEARDWLRQALRTEQTDETRAVGLHGLAGLTRVGGNHQEARDLGTEALEIFRQRRNTRRITRTLLELSLTCLALNDLDKALEYATEARDLAGEIQDERCRGAALYRIGLVHRHRGETADAERVTSNALACWQRIGYRHGVVVALGNLAATAQAANDPDRARRLAGDSLGQAREIGFTEGRLDAIETLGKVAAEEGRTAMAAWFKATVEHHRRD